MVFFLVSGLDYGSPGQSRPGIHPVASSSGLHDVVRNEGNKPRLCVLCKFYKRKTKSGWKAYSRFHCNTCQVNLCKGDRDCFKVYHVMLERGIIDLDVLRLQTNVVERHRDEMTMFMQEQEKSRFSEDKTF